MGLPQLPRSRRERVGFRRQGADRAKIHDIARQLGREGPFDIGAHFHFLAATGCAEFFYAGDFGRETNAAGAVNAPRHDRFHQRAKVFVFDGPLVLNVAVAIASKGHSLVLQIAFAALVANWTIEGMVDQEKFHHPFARLFYGRRIGVDHHAVGNGHRAGGDRFGRLFHFDQAHPAVTGDRQAVVIAEPRHFGASNLAGLEDGKAVFDRQFVAVNG